MQRFSESVIIDAKFVFTGFELVKQNRFAKKSECSKEKGPEKIFGFANHFMKNVKSFVN